MKRALIVLIVALLAGCTATAAPQAGPSPKPTLPPENPGPGDHLLAILQPDGSRTDFLLHAPPGYASGKPYPLVMVFHGSPGSADDMVKMTGLNALADTKGFVVMYPKNVFDTKVAALLLDHVIPKWGIDPKRVHATGFSMGGYITYGVAENLTARFGSVAPVSGSGASPAPHTGPISLITFQGSKDRLASTFVTDNTNWAKASGCGKETQTTKTLGSYTVHRFASTCNGGSEHVVYSVATMGHEWPPGASELIWEFFEKHPLP